jgi:hypothetical protein
VKTVMQVLVGLALCAALVYVLIYHSNMPCFWEQETPGDPLVYSITWRSYTMLAVLLALTQVISFAVFRFLFSRRLSPSTN